MVKEGKKQKPVKQTDHITLLACAHLGKNGGGNEERRERVKDLN